MPCMSGVVPRGCGGVGAAGGGGPAHDAWFRLAEPPAGGLLAAVVPPAQGCQAALAGAPGRVGQAVVQVAEAGLGAAAGRRAAGGAGPDQVAEQPAGRVAVFLVLVVAGVLGDRVEGEVEPAQQVVELRRLGGVRPAWWLLAACPGSCGVVPGAGGAVAGGAGPVALAVGPVAAAAGCLPVRAGAGAGGGGPGV